MTVCGKALVALGKGSHSQAVMSGTEASKYTMVELVIQETEQNHRVVSSVKEVPDVAGTPDKPRSIHSLRAISVVDSIDNNQLGSKQEDAIRRDGPGCGSDFRVHSVLQPSPPYLQGDKGRQVRGVVAIRKEFRQNVKGQDLFSGPALFLFGIETFLDLSQAV